jgi:hypothetical protein
MSVIASAYSAKERGASGNIVKQLLHVNAKLRKTTEDVSKCHMYSDVLCRNQLSGRRGAPTILRIGRALRTHIGVPPSMSVTLCAMRSPPICPWNDLRNSSERSNLRLLMHDRGREVVSHNSASAALECSEIRWRTRAGAASQPAYRPLARRGATTPAAKG